MIKPMMARGCYEWADVTPESEVGWATFERATGGIFEAQGDFASVVLLGTLFDGDEGYEIARLTLASPIELIDWLPTRVRPVVVGGTATVRLKARG